MNHLKYIIYLSRRDFFNSCHATSNYKKILYYIDMSVLSKNRQLVFSIRNYIWNTSDIFWYPHKRRYRWHHSFVFPPFFCLVLFYFWNTHIYVIKRKLLLVWRYEVHLLEIKIIHSLAALPCGNIFSMWR